MWSKLSIPLKVGLSFGLLGVILALIGIGRGSVPLNPASIAMALVISGGVWFVVSWAVATAAADVETDVAAAQEAVQEAVHNSDDDGL